MRQQGAADRYEEVLAEVPRVRKELGYPPLVTPSSQIVGTQATLNVITGRRYQVIPEEVKNYVRGFYGRPPAPIDEKVKALTIGDEEPITSRPADLLPPGMEQARQEIGDLAQNNEGRPSRMRSFPRLPGPYLERRARGADEQTPKIAAIAATVAAMADKNEAASPVSTNGKQANPWKQGLAS